MLTPAARLAIARQVSTRTPLRFGADMEFTYDIVFDGKIVQQIERCRAEVMDDGESDIIQAQAVDGSWVDVPKPWRAEMAAFVRESCREQYHEAWEAAIRATSPNKRCTERRLEEALG